MVNDGANVSTAYTNIVIIPVPDSPPALNPDGDPIMKENMGPISVIYNITDDDQLSQHQLIRQINISIDNPSTNEVSVQYILIFNFFPFLNYGHIRLYLTHNHDCTLSFLFVFHF